jgi:hypothetical protein
MTKDVLKYLQPNAVIPIDMKTTTALVNALKERLAQPEQEPLIGCVNHDCAKCKPLTNGEIYTAYITATNQTLRATDERLAFAFARAIEAAHGIKENT